MKIYFLLIPLVAISAVLMSVSSVSAAILPIDSCDDFATTTNPGDVLLLANSFSCIGRGGSEDISDVVVEGNGFTITIEDDLGLFDEVENVTIQNVIVTGTINLTSGGFGGIGQSASNTVISNVTNSLHLASNTTTNVGGSALFFADVYGPLTIEESTFNGSFTAIGNFGYMAIVASDVRGDLTFSNNTFEGSMNFSGNDGGGVIGVLGSRVGIFGATTIVSSSNNVYNTSVTINHATTTETQMNSVGQLFGDMGGQSGNNYSILFTSTNDSIGGSFSVSTTAGINDLGAIIGTISQNSTSTISGLTVGGAMTVSAEFLSGAAASGIGGMGGSLTFLNSTSTRSTNIIFTHASSTYIQEIGTWVGELGGSSTTLNNLASTGDITISAETVPGGSVQVSSIGGVVGLVSGDTLSVSNTSYDGDITISTDGYVNEVGGLFGRLDATNTTITYSAYSGNITITTIDEIDEIGGITGDSDRGVYDNITSTVLMTLTATEYIYDTGGFIGRVNDDIYMSNINVDVDIELTDARSEMQGVGGVFGWVDEYEVTATDVEYTGSITVDAEGDVYSFGGFAGYFEVEDSDITNVTTTITLTLTQTSSTAEVEDIGGFAGFFDNEDYDSYFTNIVVYGVVSTTAAGDVSGIGGVIGEWSDYVYNVYIDGMHNHADVVVRQTSVDRTVQHIAGVIAYMPDDQEEDFELNDIINTGDITVYGAMASTTILQIGGIFGQFDAEGGENIPMTNTLNSGDITIYGSAAGVYVGAIGGIAGTLEDSFRLAYATSTGDIVIYVEAANTEVEDVGLIIGENDDNTELTHVVVLGDISIYANAAGTEVNNVAGVVGYNGDSLFVSSTYYQGTITIEGGYQIDGVAGIVGDLQDNASVSTTYAIVDIVLSLGQAVHNTIYDVGGFIGGAVDEATVSNSFVAGTIDITIENGSSDEDVVVYDVGGFVGAHQEGVFMNTYADVEITIETINDDVENIGAYAGQIGEFDSEAQIVSSFAAGAVQLSAGGDVDAIGGFIGYHNSSTLISDNYFDIARTGYSNCSNVTFDGCIGINNDHEDSDYFIGNNDSAPILVWDFDDVWQLDEDYYPVLAFAPYDGSETIVSAPRTSSGGSSFIAPSAPSVTDTTADFVVQSGAAATDNRLVTLTFTNVKNASSVAFSNTPDFSSVSYVPFDTESYSHTLTEGNGIKTVYAKLRSSQGGTLLLTDTINLTGQDFDQTVETTPTSAGASSCPLSVQTAYKTPDNSAVYYITKDCTKRGFSSATLYFTYFFSWSDVQLTTQPLLNSVPNDTIGFLPLGPKYAPTSGALVKTLFDAKTYLLLQGTLYHIEDEAAAEFQFGPTWATWIEGVDERLLQNYPLSDIKLNTTDRLDGMLIKYPNDAKVYQLATESGVQVKRWIPTKAAFQALNFRDDRIVTIPTSESYTDGSDITS